MTGVQSKSLFAFDGFQMPTAQNKQHTNKEKGRWKDDEMDLTKEDLMTLKVGAKGGAGGEPTV